MSVIASIRIHLLPKLRCTTVSKYKLSSEFSSSWLAKCCRLHSSPCPPLSICVQRLHTSVSCYDRDNLHHFSDDDFEDGQPRRGGRSYTDDGAWNIKNRKFGGNLYYRETNKFSQNDPSADRFEKEPEPVDIKNLPPLRKDFFQPNEEVLQEPVEHHENFLKQHKITVTGRDVPPPIQKFSDHQFPEGISKNLAAFDAPTPIQAQGWSIALKGLDMIGIGQTGSGKTLGYLLPGLLHIAHHQQLYKDRKQLRRDAPVGLVLAPTRELAQQIMEVATKYGPAIGVKPVVMFGGASRDVQLNNLYNRSAQLVVATPGRLLDFLDMRQISLGQCSYLVLDEADRMLDMGFEPQIRSIVQHTRSDRQTLMWSATWPSEVQELAASFLTDPVQLSVGSTELRANPDISQCIHICSNYDKLKMLGDLLREMLDGQPGARAMVFCETKRMVDSVCQNLQRNGFRARAIHGDKTQRMRDTVLNGFRQRQTSILVATDVAARGIDIPDLTCVVNFDFPNGGVESYIHRIGRTGRQGNKGYAHCFFTADNAQHARELIKVLRDAEQPVSEELQTLAEQNINPGKKGFGGGRRHGGNSFHRPYGGGRGNYRQSGRYRSGDDDDDYNRGHNRRRGGGGYNSNRWSNDGWN
ncbi:DEAD/DEAH box helicase domain [Trinorchestia longiramus]|nr:DEAD/DEAH box helicase domain [Trinorchestia longiramus]